MKHATLLYLLFFIKLNAMAQETIESNYEQRKASEIENLLKNDGIGINDFDYQLDTNYALVYTFKNGELALLPGNMSKEENGLLIKSEKVLQKMIDDDFFPVDSKEISGLEKYADEFSNIPEYVDEYFNFLEQKLKIEIGENFNEDFFLTFDRALKEYGLSKNRNALFPALVALLGELIIRTHNGHWMVKKEYSLFNPYYEVYVVVNGVELNITSRIMEDLENPSFFQLKQSHEILTNPKWNPMLR